MEVQLRPKVPYVSERYYKGRKPDAEKLQAAILGITPPADYAICGIPDSAHTTEAYREALLFAPGEQIQNPLLVWRMFSYV